LKKKNFFFRIQKKLYNSNSFKVPGSVVTRIDDIKKVSFNIRGTRSKVIARNKLGLGEKVTFLNKILYSFSGQYLEKGKKGKKGKKEKKVKKQSEGNKRLIKNIIK